MWLRKQQIKTKTATNKQTNQISPPAAAAAASGNTASTKQLKILKGIIWVVTQNGNK